MDYNENNYIESTYLQGKYSKAILTNYDVEEESISQIINLCNQPYSEGSDIIMMPDMHAGKGCTIGTTMTYNNKICPNIVGVDIGCGITVAEFSLSNRDDLDLALCDEIINERIPAGFNIHEHPVAFYKNYSNSVRCYDYLKDIPRIKRSIGTLGGGNHYIEISRSEETGRYIFMVHSGSRNFGKQIAECYQRLAEKVCEDNIPHDLKYLTGEHLENYIHDTVEAQKYAELNRNTMIHLFFEGLAKAGYILNPFDTWQSIHNYVDTEHKIIRKGAISAYKGQKCIIPLNMRDGSLICIGKGNPTWNCSAPHGAGRKMSRAKAKENIDYDVFKESMNGIYTSSVCRNTLDESPQAYKDASEIERLIAPTVEIVEHLKPLYNFKAH